jgi:hypothetical protein
MNTAEIEVFPALTGDLHPGRKPERLRAPASAAGQQANRVHGSRTQRAAVRPDQPPGIK